MKDINLINWNAVYSNLNRKGYGVISDVFSPEECNYLISLYDDALLYRNVVNMERYRFGKGEYKYFNYPLPLIIQSCRELFYPRLAWLANEWMKALSFDNIFPGNHQQLLEQCHRNNQVKPTPLILRYESGGYNTLHQDLYGDVFFPFQMVFVLSKEGKDFEGGEFVITEQLPRAQSKAAVVKLKLGDALIFTTNFRPVKGARGYYRARVKHGVSEILSGVRYSMGIIFHDAA